jgi:hypothetical protein
VESWKLNRRQSHVFLMDGHSTAPAIIGASQCAVTSAADGQLHPTPQHTINRPSNMQYAVNTQTSNPTNSSYPGNETKPINRLVQGYAEMVTDRVNDGWSCHLLTFLFSQLPGPRSAVISRMKDEVHRVYSTFITRVTRKPRTASPDRLPVLIAAADLPVYKRDRASSPKAHCNGGLHFHALLLTPASSRLVDAVDGHFRLNERHYLGQSGIMAGIHVRPVTSDPGYVVEYVFKTVLRERVSYDEGILILPRAASELAPGKSPLCQERALLPSRDRVH